MLSKASCASLVLVLSMLTIGSYASESGGFGTSGGASSGGTELRGMISSPVLGGNTGLGSVTVTLYNHNFEPIEKTVTNDSGVYFFHNVAAGQYVITAVGSRYEVEVSGGPEQDIAPILVREAPPPQSR